MDQGQTKKQDDLMRSSQDHQKAEISQKHIEKRKEVDEMEMEISEKVKPNV